MPDWLESLNEQEKKIWDEFVDHVRRDAVEKITGSEFMVSLVPEKTDIKFAVELGLGIMSDKPILIIGIPGKEIPKKLALIADSVVYADIDTEEGREKFQTALGEFIKNHKKGQGRASRPEVIE